MGMFFSGETESSTALRWTSIRLEMTRAPVPVLEGVAMWSSRSGETSGSGNVYYDVSRHGDLLFSPRETRLPRRTLVLVGRDGRREPLSRALRSYSDLYFSPDGRSIAVSVVNDLGVPGTFVVDVASDVWTRVGDVDQYLVPMAWMPDGKSLLLYDARNGRDDRILVAPVDGSAPSATIRVRLMWLPPSVAPDASALLFDRQTGPQQWDIWRLALTGDHSAAPWLSTPGVEMSPSFSPDGNWVAYRSDDSGRPEVYVRRYSGTGGRHRVSTEEGSWPRWSRDGREIFFSSQGSLWSAGVRTTPVFTSDPPRKLFDLTDDILSDAGFYDASPDGNHFVMVQKEPFEQRPPDLVIVPGWIEEMRARLAAAN